MTKRVYTPKDIDQKRYEQFGWSGRWLAAFGDPAVNSKWFVLGPSASGKSSFVMQLSKELSQWGTVLYLSYEEGVGMEFQRRMRQQQMNEVQGRFQVVPDETVEEIGERLEKNRKIRFVVVDSFQMSQWSYEDALSLVRRFPKKGFIFVSQEYKGQPIGKAAIRLRYMADMKVRVAGYKAYCQGRSQSEPGNSFVVWEEGVLMTSNHV